MEATYSNLNFRVNSLQIAIIFTCLMHPLKFGMVLVPSRDVAVDDPMGVPPMNNWSLFSSVNAPVAVPVLRQLLSTSTETCWEKGALIRKGSFQWQNTEIWDGLVPHKFLDFVLAGIKTKMG